MRNYIILFLCITLICLTTIGTACKNKSEVQTAVAADDKASEYANDDSADPIHTIDVASNGAPGDSTGDAFELDAALPKVERCMDGNCPCGDGFCAKNSVCIKDKCFCGAFLEKGFIDNNAIVSNLYGEFECARYVSYEQCTIYRTEYNFICTRNGGCKTGDGRHFPLMDLSALKSFKSSYNAYGMYVSSRSFFYVYREMYEKDFPKDVDLDDDLILNDNTYEKVEYGSDKLTFYADDPTAAKSNRFVSYEDLIRESHLNNCGKSLPENLKFKQNDLYVNYKTLVDKQSSDDADRYYYNVEDFEISSDFECDLRKSCNDRGVTPEHVDEYVCDIGTKYFKKCNWVKMHPNRGMYLW